MQKPKKHRAEKIRPVLLKVIINEYSTLCVKCQYLLHYV